MSEFDIVLYTLENPDVRKRYGLGDSEVDDKQ
jgi:hypothetical protein